MSYNGHANYETWNVCLWIDNDEGMYHEKTRFIRRTLLTAKRIEEFVKELMPKGTPDFDSVGDYDNVDWDEICESWTEEDQDN